MCFVCVCVCAMTQIYEGRRSEMAALAGVCGRGLWKYGCKYSSNGINATVCVYLSHTMAAWTLIARRIRDPTWQMETAINRARDRACERDRRRRE